MQMPIHFRRYLSSRGSFWYSCCCWFVANCDYVPSDWRSSSNVECARSWSIDIGWSRACGCWLCYSISFSWRSCRVRWSAIAIADDKKRPHQRGPSRFGAALSVIPFTHVGLLAVDLKRRNSSRLRFAQPPLNRVRSTAGCREKSRVDRAWCNMGKLSGPKTDQG